jgi:predicted nucleotidyltransferase
MSDKPQPPDRYPGEFLRCVVGSEVCGLSLPGGGGDRDLMGVCLENPELSIGIRKPFEQHNFRSAGGQTPSGPGDVDLQCYSLRKFIHLAVGGNPNLINMFFIPPEFREIDSTLAEEMRGLIPQIISRQAGRRFRGYLCNQRERLMGERGQKRTGQTREQYYVTTPNGERMDGKYACHMLRMGLQGIELLTTGSVTLPMEEPYRSILIGVRQGAMNQGDCVRWASEMEGQLDDLYQSDKGPLPAQPDTDYLNRWVTRTYLDAWT